MKIAVLDCFSGISGDMMLAALIDSGVPLDHLKEEIAKLGLEGFQINTTKTTKNYITASQVSISYDESLQPDRRYRNIVSLISESALATKVKENALAAFRLLGEAEARIHGQDLEDVHFHELGAIDSIIDLVGVFIGFDYLKPERVYTYPVPMGTGFTKTAHGTMPVPAPAALEVLKGYPVQNRESDFELTTPTGATIVRVLSNGILPNNFEFTPEKVGYGAGSKDIAAWPNILRLILAESRVSVSRQPLIIVETNIDDMNPEIYPYLAEKLFAINVNDVYFTPVMMKKGRTGTLISVLTEEILLNEVKNILFSETTTLGIRQYKVERDILPRSEELIETRFGKLLAKTLIYQGRKIYRPEYEECLKLARAKNLTLLDIYREIDALNAK